MSSSRDILINILTKGDASGAHKVSGSLDSVAASADKAGKALSLKVSAPLVAIGGLSVKFAADAAESADKVDAVFGPAADRINEKIGDLRKTIPATTAELQDLFSGIQDLLVPLGLAPDEAEGMSASIVELAGDLASFNNIPIAEALERIRSGLVGQYEPLLKFGVALNASTVKAKAFEQGIGDGTRELTAAERAQVSYQLILEGTAAAHGNAADTAGSAANQFKFLKSESTELMTDLGERLLPAVTSIVGGFRDVLSVASSLPDPVTNVGLAVAGLATAAGPTLVVTGSLIKNFGLLHSVAPKTAIAIRGAGGIAAAGIAGFALGSVLDEWLGFSDLVAKTFEQLDGHNEGLATQLEKNRVAMADQVGEIETAADRERARNQILIERASYINMIGEAQRDGDADAIQQLQNHIAAYNRMLGILDGVIEKNQQRRQAEEEAAAAAEASTPEALAKAAAEAATTAELERQKALRETLLSDINLEIEILDAKLAGNEELVKKLEDQKREQVIINQLKNAGVTLAEAEAKAEEYISKQRQLREQESKSRDGDGNDDLRTRLGLLDQVQQREEQTKQLRAGVRVDNSFRNMKGETQTRYFENGRQISEDAAFGTTPGTTQAPSATAPASAGAGFAPVVQAINAIQPDNTAILAAITQLANRLQQRDDQLASQIAQLGN